MAYLVARQFLVFFFSRMNAEDFVDDCYKREAYLIVVEQQLDPLSIKIGPGKPRKIKEKIPMKNLRDMGG